MAEGHQVAIAQFFNEDGNGVEGARPAIIMSGVGLHLREERLRILRGVKAPGGEENDVGHGREGDIGEREAAPIEPENQDAQACEIKDAVGMGHEAGGGQRVRPEQRQAE
jgi:hypothetical protein